MLTGQFSVGHVESSSMSDMAMYNLQTDDDGWMTQDVTIETQPRE